ncbi:MAG: hypothetical protein KC619_24600 [Myxococcales bacterium]|nr:hypothetical protein [Myxococcales bacterium]
MLVALLLVALLLAGCETVEVGPRAPAPGAPPAVEPVEEPGDAPCESLSRTQCMHSVVCTLAAPSGRSSRRYVCRPAAGNCEVGLRQLPEDRDRCAARTGCGWRPASCYCACRGAGQTAVPDGSELPDCDCECGGGPPPGCAPRDG